MTLEEFVKAERERLNRFEAHWKASNEQDPSAYPSELDDSDWAEMLMFFDCKE